MFIGKEKGQIRTYTATYNFTFATKSQSVEMLFFARYESIHLDRHKKILCHMITDFDTYLFYSS